MKKAVSVKHIPLDFLLDGKTRGQGM